MSAMQSLSVCDNVQHFMSIRACVGVRPGQKNEVYFVGFLSTFLTLKSYMACSPGGVRSINVFLIATVTRTTEEVGSNQLPSELKEV